jgi:hypothetical protein
VLAGSTSEIREMYASRLQADGAYQVTVADDLARWKFGLAQVPPWPA